MPNTFADATARNAYSIGPFEASTGKLFQQLDTGVLYRAVRQGAGAENWEQVSVQHRSSILIPLNTFREVTSGGDVGDTTANGGLLSSNTTPILRGDAAESLEVAWAAGNSDIVSSSIA